MGTFKLPGESFGVSLQYLDNEILIFGIQEDLNHFTDYLKFDIKTKKCSDTLFDQLNHRLLDIDDARYNWVLFDVGHCFFMQHSCHWKKCSVICKSYEFDSSKMVSRKKSPTLTCSFNGGKLLTGNWS